MKNKNKFRKIGMLVFIIYIGVLVYFLFFAELLGRNSVKGEYYYNLVPLKEISRFIKYRKKLGFTAVFLNIVGNMLVFIPLGSFIPIFIKKNARIWQITFITMCFSLIVECIQLITRVGSFDVDDILLNTLGGLVGGIIYFAFKKCRK